MELAKQARGDGVGRRGDGTAATDLAVPPVPPPPAHAVGRPEVLAGLRSLLAAERAVVVCGLAGTGKSTVAATLAREESARDRVCWITATPGVTTAPEALVRQLAAHLNVVRLLERGTDAPSLPLDQQLDLLGPALAAEPTPGRRGCWCAAVSRSPWRVRPPSASPVSTGSRAWSWSPGSIRRCRWRWRSG